MSIENCHPDESSLLSDSRSRDLAVQKFNVAYWAKLVSMLLVTIVALSAIVYFLLPFDRYPLSFFLAVITACVYGVYVGQDQKDSSLSVIAHDAITVFPLVGLILLYSYFLHMTLVLGKMPVPMQDSGPHTIAIAVHRVIGRCGLLLVFMSPVLWIQSMLWLKFGKHALHSGLRSKALFYITSIWIVMLFMGIDPGDYFRWWFD